jgi:hypothetical protein
VENNAKLTVTNRKCSGKNYTKNTNSCNFSPYCSSLNLSGKEQSSQKLEIIRHTMCRYSVVF